MEQMAMWIGYCVMALGTVVAVAALAGVACTYAWRKLLMDVPSFHYIRMAVQQYRKQYPPGRWAREQMNTEWNRDLKA